MIPAEGYASPNSRSRKPNYNAEMKPGLTQMLTPAQWKIVDARRAQQKKQADRRALTVKEMRAVRGRGQYRNRYFAGTFPWHRSLRDANLCNGNLFKSFTDIQVAPAVGAGLALQRTYNSQDDRIGPFGIGWTHAYDIQIAEEAPANNYTDRADFFGGQNKYHRDADGLYSPPPYLFDELSSAYDAFLVNGPPSVLDDTQIGMDGTVKCFSNHGSTVQRVCDTITDRYGNQTKLTYSQVTMPDNTVRNEIQTVKDPSGRMLTFWWADVGPTGSPEYRITQVDGPQYSVVYGYPKQGDGNLTSVTLDSSTSGYLAGPVVGSGPHLNRTTTFAYATVQGESGLLASITDPGNGEDGGVGHTLSYGYGLDTLTNSVWCESVTEPAGVDSGGHARTQTWIISPNQYGTYTDFANGSGANLAIFSDSYLRKTGWGGGNLSISLYNTNYDTSDNVLNSTREVSGPPGQAYYVSDNYTFGPHGNQLTHTVGQFSG
ncbi:MAG TPA: DUF6531 domain-containing protein, partial [Chthonomonadales bacterium]|nr:DUF6531 domain-containing protein [Chthonomonadales bacterium]